MSEQCRCGWDGQGAHPCHADGYTCRKPATRRFYTPTPGKAPYAQVPGVQIKLQLAETFACDECWAKAQKIMEAMADAQKTT